MRRMTREFGPRRISISLPSLRINAFDIDIADEIRGVRKSGFTFAPEAGTERLRKIINKEVNQEDLLISLKTASDALKEKWLSNMSERASMMVKEDLESMGPTKISDVDKTQQKIVAVCKQLEAEGKISVGGGPGEELV